MTRIGVGIIGCGNISTSYLTQAPRFAALDIRAVADINMEAARTRAAEYPGIRALTVDELLAADDISLVLNLTIPSAHFAVTKRILQAGKHAYSEKPAVLTLDEGNELLALSAATGLRVGSAPDTWMGGSHQAVRAALDAGRVGQITAGTACFLSPGMEGWHPNPDFFFLPGGGPMLDMGPYYVANLVQLLGPVRRVAALANKGRDTRVIASEPRRGQEIPVRTPTNIQALLEFRSGATITLMTSWDVFASKQTNMQLYGTEGALFVPDPNFFGDQPEIAGRDGVITALPVGNHPFAGTNRTLRNGREVADYRTAGLADMAAAIVGNRPHRCSLEFALHVVEVLNATLTSGEEGRFIQMTTTCDRPAALPPEAAEALLGHAAVAAE
ncbi:MAG: Gfo/Idh/MocA family protein [Paracoccus sp. (in: a-proteobacteria)]|uniref:Gfo/Idh/MocA family protein n=1 Tax=Paracoccus sp. TaxID=267 RepID=UPI00391CEA7A